MTTSIPTLFTNISFLDSFLFQHYLDTLRMKGPFSVTMFNVVTIYAPFTVVALEATWVKLLVSYCQVFPLVDHFSALTALSR